MKLNSLKHVIHSGQFDREMLEELFVLAQEMETLPYNATVLDRRIMICLFYEPSTRTRFSFEAAMLKLGGQILATENAKEFSSGAKGETLEDSIRVASEYGDVIVIRHFDAGSAETSSKVSRVPVLNAGDGTGHHPTQALLDIYTIYKELGKIDNLSIALVGDLAHGRTVRSLANLMGKNCRNIQFYFVSPDNVKMNDDVKEMLESYGVSFEEHVDLKEVAKKVDVIYQTRIQRERFNSAVEYQKAKGVYVIDEEILSVMKKDAIIMHPLPRVDEISYKVDKDPRAAYFRQAHNGLYVRMALLKVLLEKKA